jgi:predicted pyridoxine 5'-phosphate oxidase superfamily flavin-nucleotide-binding protein
MSTSFDHITQEQAELIRNSPVFFVASVSNDLSKGTDGQGPVNLSPKGGSPLHVIGPNRVAYLDYTGSGNETSRHARAGGSITLMVMSMGVEDAAIVRLYGHATVTPVAESPLAELLLSARADNIDLPVRQVVDVAVERTQTSCGYGVPVFEFVSQRVRAERGRRYKPNAAPVRPA